jgi:hypothetical protein
MCALFLEHNYATEKTSWFLCSAPVAPSNDLLTMTHCVFEFRPTTNAVRQLRRQWGLYHERLV